MGGPTSASCHDERSGDTENTAADISDRQDPRSSSITSHASSKAIKNAQIHALISDEDTSRMTYNDWLALYAAEQNNLVTGADVFGGFQQHITAVQRYHIVTWMSEACAVLAWSAQTFFVAIHAWDLYVTCAAHEILSSEFGSLATASLYFAAQVMECAPDENVYTLEKFKTLCPEVGQSEVVREAEVHLLDTLQGCSLCRKTPIDFFFLYLAKMKGSTHETISRLFRVMVEHNFLPKMYDMVSCVSLVFYTSGLIFENAGSIVVQCTMLHAMTNFIQSEKADLGCDISPSALMNLVCHEVFVWPGFGMIEGFYLSIRDLVQNCSNVAYKRPQSRSSKQNRSDSSGGSHASGRALDWMKHMHPDGIGELPYKPNSKATADVAMKLAIIKKEKSVRNLL